VQQSRIRDSVAHVCSIAPHVTILMIIQV